MLCFFVALLVFCLSRDCSFLTVKVSKVENWLVTSLFRLASYVQVSSERRQWAFGTAQTLAFWALFWSLWNHRFPTIADITRLFLHRTRSSHIGTWWVSGVLTCSSCRTTWPLSGLPRGATVTNGLQDPLIIFGKMSKKSTKKPLFPVKFIKYKEMGLHAATYRVCSPFSEMRKMD